MRSAIYWNRFNTCWVRNFVVGLRTLSLRKEKRPWFILFVYFCGINTPTTVNFKMQMQHRWVRSWEVIYTTDCGWCWCTLQCENHQAELREVDKSTSVDIRHIRVCWIRSLPLPGLHLWSWANYITSVFTHLLFTRISESVCIMVWESKELIWIEWSCLSYRI